MTFQATRLIFLVAILAGQNHAVGQDDDPELTEEQKSEARMTFMQEAVARFDMQLPAPDSVTAKGVEKPLLRWVNPHSSSRDGILTAFVADGRPAGMAQLAIYKGGNAVTEFHFTSESPFTFRRDGAQVWKSDKPTISFAKLTDARAPTDTGVRRLIQMRQIAGEFEVWDDHGWTKTVRQQLRLLPQPVYRYEDKSLNVVDGAVFVFALANDPEAVVLVEACEKDGSHWWQYACSPVSIYALEAKRKDEVVWTAPERRVFGRGYMTQYVGPYSMAPGDPDLKSILPKSD